MTAWDFFIVLHMYDFFVFVIYRFTDDYGCVWPDIDYILDMDPHETKQYLVYF